MVNSHVENPRPLPTQADLVRRAIEVVAQRGSASSPGSGGTIAFYLMESCELFTPGEVRGYLKNLEGAIRELKEELRAIES
jgi:hypothetical protein